MKCAESLPWLDAYVDGELGIERSVEIERHLGDCPACAAEIERRRVLGAALRQALQYHTAPPELRRAIGDELARTADAAPPQRQRTRFRQALPAWARMAAALVLAAGLGSALTYYGAPRDGGVVPDEVFASYVRGMQSQDRLVDVVSSDEHTVKPWLDAKLDFAVPVKDLASEGYPLFGGRVDYIDGRRVAALVYHYRKHVITLFVWPSSGGARPITSTVRNGDNLAEWSDGRMTFWAVSDVAAPEFMAFCRLYQKAGPVGEQTTGGRVSQ